MAQVEVSRGGAVTGAFAQTVLKTSTVPLLALAVFINYVDRGNLATAAPLVRNEFGLDHVQIGLLLGAFFWTYTPGQLLAGWLAERIDAYRTIALGVALWSLATLASGLATGFVGLLLLRLLLGLGESAAFPCSSKLLAEHLPSHRLGAANGMIGMGLALGPAFGTFVGGLLMAKTGWRPVFILFGFVSLLWLVPWLQTTREASQDAKARNSVAAPSFGEVVRRRAAWGACLGHFAANYAFYFVILWLPLYLVNERGLSVAQMAVAGGVIYILYAISAQLTGLISDAWMRAGASATLVRKSIVVAGSLGTTICLFLCATGGRDIAIASLLVAGICFGFGTTTIYAIGQTLGGPKGGGKWVAVQNCIGNIAGIVAPAVTGFVVDRTGQFTPAFLIAGIVGLLGVVGWGFIIQKIEPIDWDAVRPIGRNAGLD